MIEGFGQTAVDDRCESHRRLSAMHYSDGDYTRRRHHDQGVLEWAQRPLRARDAEMQGRHFHTHISDPHWQKCTDLQHTRATGAQAQGRCSPRVRAFRARRSGCSPGRNTRFLRRGSRRYVSGKPFRTGAPLVSTGPCLHRCIGATYPPPSTSSSPGISRRMRGRAVAASSPSRDRVMVLTAGEEAWTRLPMTR